MRLLSHSQVNLFLACPRRWWLAYVQGYRPREKAEPLVFGSVLHKRIAGLLRGGWHGLSVGPEDFVELLDDSRAIYLATVATTMMDAFRRRHKGWCDNGWFQPIEVERHVVKDGFQGYVDCIADVDGTRVVIDWKTTSRPYPNHRVHVDDQLTAYAYLSGVYEVAFVTLLKPSGDIEWHRSVRSQERVDEFVKKVQWVRHQMADGARHRNPSNCGWCPFVGHCSELEELDEKNERWDF